MSCNICCIAWGWVDFIWKKCTERLLSLIYWQLSCKLLF
ncbi:hypothetical protein F383_27419 [Gossypium arboreum]|uniref:Uncharacterized protein n=1 Tax=Gossypium arboreum TaxID=29729 RepID=A0A0B0MWU0_GOSAR|nr:hypothetical protein F383_27419 [Gossypium arboreum]